MQDQTQKISEEYTCPICFELFCEPVALNCGHTFCEDCVKDLVKRECPFRCAGGIKSQSKNFVLISIISKQYSKEYQRRLKDKQNHYNAKLYLQSTRNVRAWQYLPEILEPLFKVQLHAGFSLRLDCDALAEFSYSSKELEFLLFTTPHLRERYLYVNRTIWRRLNGQRDFDYAERLDPTSKLQREALGFSLLLGMPMEPKNLIPFVLAAEPTLAPYVEPVFYGEKNSVLSWVASFIGELDASHFQSDANHFQRDANHFHHSESHVQKTKKAKYDSSSEESSSSSSQESSNSSSQESSNSSSEESSSSSSDESSSSSSD